MSDKKSIDRPRGLEERLELANSLLSRPRPERMEKAKEQFKNCYPDAPDEMISSAVFHVYVDGILAALDWIASAEIFLQTGDDRHLDREAEHLIYHLYNYHQFKALMPVGTNQILESIKEMKEALSEEDNDLMKELIECRLDDLEEAFDCHKSRPWLESRY
ncbi:MAG: hypothetical protein AAGG51_18725 [Cyanobacteria bacterium P01_G01_bin.54]